MAVIGPVNTLLGRLAVAGGNKHLGLIAQPDNCGVESAVLKALEVHRLVRNRNCPVLRSETCLGLGVGPGVTQSPTPAGLNLDAAFRSSVAAR